MINVALEYSWLFAVRGLVDFRFAEKLSRKSRRGSKQKSYESYLHDCELVNPCLSTCGQRDPALSNDSVLCYNLEMTW